MMGGMLLGLCREGDGGGGLLGRVGDGKGAEGGEVK